MFWGDIILHHRTDLRAAAGQVALNWGYEASHPLKRRRRYSQSANALLCLSRHLTWMSLIGRHDKALVNLRGGKAGLKDGARGYLNTDWGDGGHPQPLAVSYFPYLYGAGVSWCLSSFKEDAVVPVTKSGCFCGSDTAHRFKPHGLGFAHRKLNYFAMNVTPLGTDHRRSATTAAGIGVPGRAERYYARIPAKNLHSALEEIERQRTVLYRVRRNPRQVRCWRQSWTWQREWQRSPLISCFGSKLSRRVRLGKQRGWPQKASKHCAISSTTLKRTGHGAIKGQPQNVRTSFSGAWTIIGAANSISRRRSRDNSESKPTPLNRPSRGCVKRRSGPIRRSDDAAGRSAKCTYFLTSL